MRSDLFTAYSIGNVCDNCACGLLLVVSRKYKKIVLPTIKLRLSAGKLNRVGLWNCQSAVNKADLIPAIASQTALSILGLAETWIRPGTQQLLLHSLTTYLSLTPPVRLGRVEVLVFSFLMHQWCEDPIESALFIMALFHYMVQHGPIRYGSLLGGFPLGTVPGTWYFFSTTSAEVPSDPYRYQNVTCKLC